jgi:hypothetical protein
MQCPDCGAYITEEDLFCGECGRPLPGKAPAAEPVTASQAAAPAASTPSLPPTAPALPGKKAAHVPILLAGGLAVAALCTCVVLALVWLGIKGRGTATPVVAGPGAGGLVYADDFEDPGSGWDVFAEDDTEAGYSDGEYRVSVNQDNYVAWGTPGDKEFDNFEVEVDARQVEGPLDNNLGLLVRYQPDDDNFYWFEISSDGYYSVDMMQAGEWVGLVDWVESDAINQGTGVTNHLKVVCDGDRFVFYVNGIYLTEVTDATFASGNVGLAAGTFDEPGVVVVFDNLRLYSLQG